MKTRVSPFLIGSFVVGGLILVVAGLLSLRSLHLFSRPARFVAYFNESVQGLDVGSQVKLRGVRVGRVADMQVQYDSHTRESRVAVTAELDQGALSDRSGQRIPIADPAALRRLIGDGLRAKIALAGITGLQFVELDFFEPQDFPAPHQDDDGNYPVIPALRSGLSELVTNFSKIANSLNKVDFAGLSRELQSFLATLNHQVGGLDLPRMVAQLTAAASSVEAFAGSAEAGAAFATMNRTATDLRGLVTHLDSQVAPVQAELVRTLHSFHDAAEIAKRLLGPQTGLGEEAVRTLRQITTAAESLQQLTDFLERNPSALIRGKKRTDHEP